MTTITCDPLLEVRGESVMTLFSQYGQDVLTPLLVAHNLTGLETGRWYMMQDVLNVLHGLARTGNASSDFVSLGMKVVERMVFPSAYAELSFREFMPKLDLLYQSVHRHGDPGHITVERDAACHLICRFNGLLPDDVFYGAIFGFARRLLPPYAYFTVYYDETIPRRDQGGAETVIHVVWAC